LTCLRSPNHTGRPFFPSFRGAPPFFRAFFSRGSTTRSIVQVPPSPAAFEVTPHRRFCFRDRLCIAFLSLKAPFPSPRQGGGYPSSPNPVDCLDGLFFQPVADWRRFRFSPSFSGASCLLISLFNLVFSPRISPPRSLLPPFFRPETRFHHVIFSPLFFPFGDRNLPSPWGNVAPLFSLTSNFLP